MKQVLYNVSYYITLFAIACLVYILARKIGVDAHRLERSQDMIRMLTGPYQGQHIRRLRNKPFIDKIEEPIRFSSRLGPDTTDRIERRGVLVRKPNARAVILICHGFTCSKDEVRFLRGCLFNHYTTLSFDFRAHGEGCTSEHICTFGNYEKYDVIGAVEFIRSQPDLAHKPIIVYGFSMGAVAALLAQAERDDLFQAAILDCPFESTDKLIERLINMVNFSVAGYEFGIPGKSILQKYAYNSYVQELMRQALRIKTSATDTSSAIRIAMMPINTAQVAARCSIPTFLIVCKKDNKAPVSAAYEIYRSLPVFKRLWITNGREHFNSFFFNPEKYGYKVFQFIEEVLDKRVYKSRIPSIDIDGPDEAVWHQRLASYT